MHGRRKALQAIAGAGVLTAASWRRVLGANDRIRVGFIGNGLIGKRHLLDFLAQPDVEVAGISEVSESRLADGIATAGGRPARYRDFRKLLDERDVDAIVVSTPDHWHALMTILACAAGKDVYVEKPLTHVVREGEWMLRTARHHRRVVQVGTQQRSGEQYKKCVELVRDGHLGDVRNVRISSSRNILPGFAKPIAPEPLAAGDWDLWLGPAPFVPYDANRCLYHFRWYWDYSGGQTTNLLSHNIDIAQWATGKTPTRVAAMGGRYSLTGMGETPDMVEALLDYPGFIVNWSSHEASAGLEGGLDFYGTKGRMSVDRARLEVFPDRLIEPDDQIPSFTGPRRTVAAEPRWRTEPIKLEGYDQVRDQFVPHVRNFLDCVKSRQEPASGLASAQETNVACHLVNVAMKLGRVVRWDAAKQDVVGDAEASRLLTKDYRAPWDRELRAALPPA
jgi:predicted dehydrogenase